MITLSLLKRIPKKESNGELEFLSQRRYGTGRENLPLLVCVLINITKRKEKFLCQIPTRLCQNNFKP